MEDQENLAECLCDEFINTLLSLNQPQLAPEMNWLGKPAKFKELERESPSRAAWMAVATKVSFLQGASNK